MGGFTDPILDGGGNIVSRAQEQSPNFVHGVAGWRIAADGSAEFNNIVIRGSTSTNGTILVYNGTPAAGNLIISIAPASGTDAYGNAYPQGVGMSGTGGQLLAQLGNQILELQANAGVGPAISLNPDSTHFQPGQVYAIVGGNQPQVAVVSPFPTGSSVAAGASQLIMGGKSVDGTTTPIVSITPYAVAFHPGTQNDETWQTPTPGSGWALGPGGGTVQQVQYRIDTQDNLVIVGAIHTTSATPASTMFSLPAAYAPGINQRVVCVTNNGGTPSLNWIEVPPSGNVFMGKAITASNTDVYFSVCVPRGNIT